MGSPVGQGFFAQCFIRGNRDVLTELGGLKQAQLRRPLRNRPYKDKLGLLAALHDAHASMNGPDVGAYAGDVSPTYAYEVLKAEPDAVLVDVRTRAEWAFVGVPDLSDLGKMAAFIEWKRYPDMSQNDGFLTDLDKLMGDKRDAAVFFLCRSGARSQAAATAATEVGYARAFNIEDGFEGPLNPARHRGSAGGWKAEGLPWAQT